MNKPATQILEPELDLLERVLLRDGRAWNDLLRRYRPMVYRCITKVTSRLGNHLCENDVDEIFSDFCFNLLRNDLRKLRAFDPDRNVRLSTWLGLLAINTAYDFLRRRSRRPLLDRMEQAPEPPSPAHGPLEQLLAKERMHRLADLLGDLSERDRCFVRLYYLQGQEADAVARKMNISVKTVYTKKHKISRRLGRLAEARLAA